MKTSKHGWRAGAVIAAALCGTPLALAQAPPAAGWWGGSWTCTIDGRPARMAWTMVNVAEGDCEGSVCTQVAGAEWRGKFSDNGSRWVPLTNPRRGSRGGLYFNHADGNRWFLPRPIDSRTKGWTTWQGQRYPLSCRR
ncbi:DUF6006 family protein [Pseudoduganella chitinolytica]|uniref:DUF6006 family protein n=1 Tax=Pseudoduganella chitinolytica TaxID=34070 RepID=A0ABY8BHI3_9BURK|nr:DUF6006 family protein [Pseudoduganella chitinolytica]WEF35126.1 DUF6006 family protein [Pseudoduganella chitinolytica]